MKTPGKALVTLLCLFILIQNFVSVKADETLSYTLDYTTVEGDRLSSYITSIQVIQNGENWQVWVGEGSEKGEGYDEVYEILGEVVEAYYTE